MNVYPIYLTRLHEKNTVLLGGDHEAERKIAELLEAKARLTVISPHLTDDLRKWAEDGRFEWIPRHYKEGDLEGAFMAIVAEFEGNTNEQVYREAERLGILVNVMDDIPHANFSFGSLVKRGPLTLSISTSGAAPTLAVRLRERFEKEFGEEYNLFLTLMHKMRDPMKKHYSDFDQRKDTWYQLVDSDVLDLIRKGQTDQALQKMRQIVGDEVADEVLELTVTE
ncbi:MAG: bifunctional precorrin-2 dehydrogenase/sirohydrochlorin ferrochelatase [Balneolaceae bacterium]|nr:bifunctional precorrin-2 dehydrogenase/sirohydrochlorin ferrochelatase [Balneolaceae bacterium]